MSEQVDSELRGLRLQAALAEYQALRAETLHKIGNHLQLYSVLITSIAVLVGWAITSDAYDVLLALPIACTGFALRYLWEQTVVIMLGDYLRMIEREIIPPLIGTRPGSSEHERYWIGWQHYFHDHFPRSALYKPAVVILMVFIPFVPAVAHSGLVVIASITGTAPVLQTDLPVSIHAAVIILYPLVALYLLRRLVAS